MEIANIAQIHKGTFHKHKLPAEEGWENKPLSECQKDLLYGHHDENPGMYLPNSVSITLFVWRAIGP